MPGGRVSQFLDRHFPRVEPVLGEKREEEELYYIVDRVIPQFRAILSELTDSATSDCNQLNDPEVDRLNISLTQGIRKLIDRLERLRVGLINELGYIPKAQ